MMFQTTTLRLVERLPAKYQLTVKQFLKFGIVGTIGALVDFSTYALLTRGLGWTTLYTVLGYEISAANNVSVLLAIISNFVINRWWTFRGSGGSAASQGVGYLLMNGVTWVLNQFLVSYFTFEVVFFNKLFGEKKDFVAKALAIGIIMFANFFGSKFIIFRKKPAAVV